MEITSRNLQNQKPMFMARQISDGASNVVNLLMNYTTLSVFMDSFLAHLISNKIWHIQSN